MNYGKRACIGSNFDPCASNVAKPNGMVNRRAGLSPSTAQPDDSNAQIAGCMGENKTAAVGKNRAHDSGLGQVLVRAFSKVCRAA